MAKDINVRFEDETYEVISNEATAEDRSVASLVRRLVEQHFAEQGKLSKSSKPLKGRARLTKADKQPVHG